MPSLMPVAARKRSSRLEDRLQTRRELRGHWDTGRAAQAKAGAHKLSAHAKAVTMNSASARERTATAHDTRGRTSSADSAKFAKDRDRQAATRRGFSPRTLIWCQRGALNGVR